MDHENSQQSREFLLTYVYGNQELITDWLDGSGNPEDTGPYLLCFMVERLAIDQKPDLNGIADGYIINLLQAVLDERLVVPVSGSPSENDPAPDYQRPLMSLPLHFGDAVAALKAHRYLTVPAARTTI